MKRERSTIGQMRGVAERLPVKCMMMSILARPLGWLHANMNACAPHSSKTWSHLPSHWPEHGGDLEFAHSNVRCCLSAKLTQ